MRPSPVITWIVSQTAKHGSPSIFRAWSEPWPQALSSVLWSAYRYIWPLIFGNNTGRTIKERFTDFLLAVKKSFLGLFSATVTIALRLESFLSQICLETKSFLRQKRLETEGFLSQKNRPGIIRAGKKFLFSYSTFFVGITSLISIIFCRHYLFDEHYLIELVAYSHKVS